MKTNQDCWQLNIVCFTNAAETYCISDSSNPGASFTAGWRKLQTEQRQWKEGLQCLLTVNVKKRLCAADSETLKCLWVSNSNLSFFTQTIKWKKMITALVITDGIILSTLLWRSISASWKLNCWMRVSVHVDSLLHLQISVYYLFSTSLFSLWTSIISMLWGISSIIQFKENKEMCTCTWTCVVWGLIFLVFVWVNYILCTVDGGIFKVFAISLWGTFFWNSSTNLDILSQIGD